jgi:hypothetical protein
MCGRAVSPRRKAFFVVPFSFVTFLLGKQKKSKSGPEKRLGLITDLGEASFG